MKKLAIIAVVVLVGLGLIGCQQEDALSIFEKSVSSEIALMNQYDAVESDDLYEQTLNQLSFSHVQTLSTSLDATSMTTVEKIEYARSLYDEIRVLHAQNVIKFVENKSSFTTLKENVVLFREGDFTLTEEDESTLLLYKDELATRRLVVKETIGDIRDLLVELKGNYNLEHIDLIISNFETIKEILQLRQDHMIYVSTVLVDVNLIVSAYLD